MLRSFTRQQSPRRAENARSTITIRGNQHSRFCHKESATGPFKGPSPGAAASCYSRPPRHFMRSERHYDVRREGTPIEDDSDDPRLELLADLEPDPDAVGAVLKRPRIRDAAKFRLELERRAWRRSGYRLQQRILNRLDCFDSH